MSSRTAQIALDEGRVVALAAPEGHERLGEVVPVGGLLAAAAGLAGKHPEAAALLAFRCHRSTLKKA